MNRRINACRNFIKGDRRKQDKNKQANKHNIKQKQTNKQI